MNFTWVKYMMTPVRIYVIKCANFDLFLCETELRMRNTIIIGISKVTVHRGEVDISGKPKISAFYNL